VTTSPHTAHLLGEGKKLSFPGEHNSWTCFGTSALWYKPRCWAKHTPWDHCQEKKTIFTFSSSSSL